MIAPEWTAAVFRDGELVADPVPCSDYVAAEVLAPLTVGWLGGPVSIVQAVVANREPAESEQPSLFDEAAA